MITDAINELRRNNGKPHIYTIDSVECYNCLLHCLHMARICGLEHSPEHFRQGKAEAIAKCNYIYNNARDIIRYMVLNLLANSPGHKNILISYSHYAYYFYVNNYQAYLTVRAW